MSLSCHGEKLACTLWATGGVVTVKIPCAFSRIEKRGLGNGKERRAEHCTIKHITGRPLLSLYMIQTILLKKESLWFLSNKYTGGCGKNLDFKQTAPFGVIVLVSSLLTFFRSSFFEHVR